MPRWLGSTSPAMRSTASGTTPSHRDRKIKLLFPDRPLDKAVGASITAPPSHALPALPRAGERPFLHAGEVVVGAEALGELWVGARQVADLARRVARDQAFESRLVLRDQVGYRPRIAARRLQ